MSNRTLRIHVVDQHRRAYGAPVVIEVKHRTLKSYPVQKVKHPTGEAVDIKGLDGPPKGDYQITVTSQDGKKHTSQFLNIQGKKDKDEPVVCIVVLEAAKPCIPLPAIHLPGGVEIGIGPAFEDEGEWKAYIKANPLIPRKLENMLAVARRLFPKQGVTGVESTGALRHLDECAESLFSHFLLGFQNPIFKSKKALGEVEKAIAEAELKPVTSSPTDYFEVHWYTTPPKKAWVKAFLEDIDDVYREMVKDFRPPYLPGDSPSRRIPLHIRDFQRIRGMTCSESPEIHLNRRFLDTPFAADLPVDQRGDQLAERRQRKALLAHELFHRIEYAYGFRRFALELPFQWYSEGLASWAEVRYGETVTSDQKSLGFAKISQGGLYGASYFAMTFWLDLPDNVKKIRGFLEEFERNGGHGELALQGDPAKGRPGVVPDFMKYYLDWAYKQGGDDNPPVSRPAAVGTKEAKRNFIPLHLNDRDSWVGPDATRYAEFRATGRPLSIFQFGIETFGSRDPSSPSDRPTFRPFEGKAVVSATINGKPAPLIKGGTFATAVTPSGGDLLVTHRVPHEGSAVPLESAETPSAVCTLQAPAHELMIDELGNVKIERTGDGGSGPGGTIVLGYSVAAPWRTNHSSMAWSSDLNQAASSGELVQAGPPQVAGNTVVVTVRPRWPSGRLDIEMPIQRRIEVKGQILTVDTTTRFQELILIQRSTTSGSLESADLDGGANSECKGDDCDPVVGAAMMEPKLVDPPAEADFVIGQPWWPAPGWVMLPTTCTGPSHTIRQVYCLGGGCS